MMVTLIKIALATAILGNVNTMKLIYVGILLSTLVSWTQR